MRAYLNFSTLVDTQFAFSMLSKEQFVEYHSEENDDICLEIEEHFRLTDDEAIALIKKVSKSKTVSEFQFLDRETRNSCIHKLHDKGLSIRQISRLTGISKKIVELNI